MDIIFIEPLCRSMKHEAVYLRELSDGFQAQRVIARWMEIYNTQRPHSALDASTPAEAYQKGMLMEIQTEPHGTPALCRLNRSRKTCSTGPWRHDRLPGIHLNSATHLSDQPGPPQ